MSLRMLLATLILLQSCSGFTPAKKFSRKSVDYKKHGIFFGKLKVNLNGKQLIGMCNIQYFDGDSYKWMRVTQKGNFAGKAGPGKISFTQLVCDDATRTFPEGDLSFVNKIGKESYLGNFEIEWKEGSFNPIVTVLALLVGWWAFSKSGTKFVMKNLDSNGRYIASTKKRKRRINQIIKVPSKYN